MALLSHSFKQYCCWHRTVVLISRPNASQGELILLPAGRTRHHISFCDGLRSAKAWSQLFPFTLKLSLLDLKCGFADFPLIGMRAAPDNKVILRPLEQNLAPERRKNMDALRGRSGADCFACRIMTAVSWIKPDAPRREDRKEKPLLAWGRGRSPARELSLRIGFENWV
jgi:hypothetical protein